MLTIIPKKNQLILVYIVGQIIVLGMTYINVLTDMTYVILRIPAPAAPIVNQIYQRKYYA
jgi:hypothetical protein